MAATALDGTLVRHSDGWRWSDGASEPRVRDLTLRPAGAPTPRLIHGAPVTHEPIARDSDDLVTPPGAVDLRWDDQQPVAVEWDPKHEAAILVRAAALGWRDPR